MFRGYFTSDGVSILLDFIHIHIFVTRNIIRGVGASDTGIFVGIFFDDKVGNSIDGIGIEKGVDGLGEGVLGCNHSVWLILFHMRRQDMKMNQANQFRQIFQAICYCINTVQQTDKITLFT